MAQNTLAAILTAAMLATAGAAQAQPNQPLFLFIYSPGPAWKPGVPAGQQALAPHGKYMASLAADGRLVAGGPLLDADGGMAILHAADAEAARAILAADPAVKAGIMKAEIHGWSPQFGSNDPLLPKAH
ncbi:MAG TPA: YciI family protein [Phenylobacterium sp.]|jgi:uncharacterized protein YciI|uniref:YciI family protein n=1 Tax=Phenylobacterium sp. TaxID=1871053 RepID=UPI002BC06F82|nr:YciI family protein [Phenylobacterium sp.]HXA38867.1 YciI family protein [Phenylobacterium sp.]